MARILLVDDDNELVECMGHVLRGEGHQVRTASTGREGLAVLRSAPLPDLVVLDVDMPILDGRAMAHEMLVHNAGEERVPVLLVSARADLHQIACCVGTPYSLSKPCDVGAFLAVLDQVIRERRAPKPPPDATTALGVC